MLFLGLAKGADLLWVHGGKRSREGPDLLIIREGVWTFKAFLGALAEELEHLGLH